MQIIKLDLPHLNFFCPVTGWRLSGPQFCEASPALAATWHCEALDTPEIYHPELEELWDEYVEKTDQDDDLFDVPAFLASVSLENLVCFEITTHGIACGPMSATEWYVIDMNYGSDDSED